MSHSPGPPHVRYSRLRSSLSVGLALGWAAGLAACSQWTNPLICVGDCLEGTTTQGEDGASSDAGTEADASANPSLPPSYDPSCADGRNTPGELCLDPLGWFIEPLLPTGVPTMLIHPVAPSQAPEGAADDVNAIFFNDPIRNPRALSFIVFRWDEHGATALLDDRIDAGGYEHMMPIETQGPMDRNFLIRSDESVTLVFPFDLMESGFQRARFSDAAPRADAKLFPFWYPVDDGSATYRYGAWGWSEERIRFDWTESMAVDSPSLDRLTEYVVSEELRLRDAEIWASGEVSRARGTELVGLRRDTLVIGSHFPEAPQVSRAYLPTGLQFSEHEILALNIIETPTRPLGDVLILSQPPSAESSLITLIGLEQAVTDDPPRVTDVWEQLLPGNARSMHVGHLDADEVSDVVVIHETGVLLSLVLRRDRATEVRPLRLDPQIAPHAVAMGDLNADGTHDLVLIGAHGGFSGVLPALP